MFNAKKNSTLQNNSFLKISTKESSYHQVCVVHQEIHHLAYIQILSLPPWLLKVPEIHGFKHYNYLRLRERCYTLGPEIEGF